MEQTKVNQSQISLNTSYKLETFCSLVNSLEDFDTDSCYDGRLEFEVPILWLIEYLNEELDTNVNSALKIKNLDDLNNWCNNSTYYDTEFIFRKAEVDNVLTSNPIVYDCKYCEKSLT